MDQWLTIFIGAIVIGIITLIIGAGYTSAHSSKLPENGEMIQLFLAGSIIGTVISWIMTSGYLHGSNLASMIQSDITSSLKDVGLKGGDESIPKQTNSLASMVGGFFSSLGASPEAIQEMTVGMPNF
jgi:xanthine/uracil/vitamin C permease (AzgA family)